MLSELRNSSRGPGGRDVCTNELTISWRQRKVISNELGGLLLLHSHVSGFIGAPRSDPHALPASRQRPAQFKKIRTYDSTISTDLTMWTSLWPRCRISKPIENHLRVRHSIGRGQSSTQVHTPYGGTVQGEARRAGADISTHSLIHSVHIQDGSYIPRLLLESMLGGLYVHAYLAYVETQAGKCFDRDDRSCT
jgi:hypothetical protein